MMVPTVATRKLRPWETGGLPKVTGVGLEPAPGLSCITARAPGYCLTTLTQPVEAPQVTPQAQGQPGGRREDTAQSEAQSVLPGGLSLPKPREVQKPRPEPSATPARDIKLTVSRGLSLWGPKLEQMGTIVTASGESNRRVAWKVTALCRRVSAQLPPAAWLRGSGSAPVSLVCYPVEQTVHKLAMLPEPSRWTAWGKATRSDTQRRACCGPRPEHSNFPLVLAPPRVPHGTRSRDRDVPVSATETESHPRMRPQPALPHSVGKPTVLSEPRSQTLGCLAAQSQATQKPHFFYKDPGRAACPGGHRK